MVERLFGLRKHQTTIRTEITAGVTTFMTMAYVLAVNPSILSACGMDAPAVFVATALSAAIGTAIMAFTANLPIALAPGMGINAFFAYTIVIGMGHSWQFALTAVFLEGLIFILLTLTNLRDAILDCIPLALKKAMSAGIGLFIAFLGLQGGGIVTKHEATLVSMGTLTTPATLVALLGLAFTGVLLCFRVRGALLYGILGATLAGVPLGVTQLDALKDIALLSIPSIAPTFWQFEWHSVLTSDMLVVLFVLLFGDIFNTVGTLIGVAAKGNMLDEQGRLPEAKSAFLSDAIATSIGAVLGTSTVTAYVESASGVAEGGRTGLTALTVAVLFLCALFWAPLFLLVPAAATSGAMIIVGLFMISPIAEVDFSDYREGIPAFLTIVIMPLTYNIANGIIFGIISYALLNLCTGRGRQVPLLTYILAVLFICKVAFAE